MSADFKTLLISTSRSFGPQIGALWVRWMDGELSSVDFEVESKRLLKIEDPDFTIRGLRRRSGLVDPVDAYFAEGGGAA